MAERQSDSCDGCVFKPALDEPYLDPCGQCSRFYADEYEPEGDLRGDYPNPLPNISPNNV